MASATLQQASEHKERYCSIYIRGDQEQLTPQEIKTLLMGKYDEKIKGLKSLIYAIIHDENFDKLTMTIITYLVPYQAENHDLKKILLYYWEIIEKVNKDGKLKDEMILVCNSLRSDLLHPNEYLRGRTLRLVSRIMYKGILEPLISSIMESLNHKHTYVRRNAIVAIYQIFLNFGDDLINDIDTEMEKVLQNETDLSTKRNAFLLLYHTNLEKAMAYLYQIIQDDRVDEMGDIMQLSVLELFRKTCKYDPSQKSKLMKCILFFQKSRSPSVQFECANTLIQISNTPTTLKLATNIYVQLLLNNSENNVKMVVLDKIQYILNIEPKYLEEQVIEITKVLNNPSNQIRKNAIDIISSLTNSRNVSYIFPKVVKEVKKTISEENGKEFTKILLDFVEYCVFNFESVLDDVMNLINEVFLTNNGLKQKTQDQVKRILTGIVTTYPQSRERLMSKLLERFRDISSPYIYNGVLWILGEYSSGEQVTRSLDQILEAIGPLPITYVQQSTDDQKSEEKEAPKPTQKKYKTVILADGSYGTEVIEEKEARKQSIDANEQQDSQFRIILSQYSYIGSIAARTLLKLVFKIKLDAKKYNKYTSQILLVFCSLIRLYTAKQSKKNEEYDLDSLEKIYLGVKLLTEPKKFVNEKISWLESNENIVKHKEKVVKRNDLEQQREEKKDSHIAKQPDDLIVIRALKGKQAEIGDIDLQDEEINQIEFKGVGEDNDFASKLNKLVQLTGYSDPIYAESFVYIHKYDIQFETLLINRTTKPLQKVQIEFFTQENDQKRVIEKAQAVTLQPNQSAYVKTSLKFTSIDIGVIFGAINYENIAGIEQAYLITKEIDIDLIDFVYPAEIDFNSYREMWAKYEWENRIVINPQKIEMLQFFLQFKEQFKLYMLNDEEEIKNATVICVNFYAKTKLGDDFLINISAESQNGSITGTIRIRSKVKGVVVSIGQKYKQ
ncbi:hypothetical protein ABPG74_002654 [Tetrahymena malaccensis]